MSKCRGLTEEAWLRSREREDTEPRRSITLQERGEAGPSSIPEGAAGVPEGATTPRVPTNISRGRDPRKEGVGTLDRWDLGTSSARSPMIQYRYSCRASMCTPRQEVSAFTDACWPWTERLVSLSRRLCSAVPSPCPCGAVCACPLRVRGKARRGPDGACWLCRGRPEPLPPSGKSRQVQGPSEEDGCPARTLGQAPAGWVLCQEAADATVSVWGGW